MIVRTRNEPQTLLMGTRIVFLPFGNNVTKVLKLCITYNPEILFLDIYSNKAISKAPSSTYQRPFSKTVPSFTETWVPAGKHNIFGHPTAHRHNILCI